MSRFFFSGRAESENCKQIANFHLSRPGGDNSLPPPHTHTLQYSKKITGLAAPSLHFAGREEQQQQKAKAAVCELKDGFVG